MSHEFVPVDAYRILRRLSASAEDKRELRGIDEESGVMFLLDRKLAALDSDGHTLRITDEGKAVGRITRKAP